MSQFIGRGERLVRSLLTNPFSIQDIFGQVPLENLIPRPRWNLLDEEVQKHKFDFVAVRHNHKKLVIEVNYKHGEKSAKKWNNIFVPLLKEFGYDVLTVDDYNCDTLFSNLKRDIHPSYSDLNDLINALKVGKIEI